MSPHDFNHPELRSKSERIAANAIVTLGRLILDLFVLLITSVGEPVAVVITFLCIIGGIILVNCGFLGAPYPILFIAGGIFAVIAGAALAWAIWGKKSSDEP